MRKTYEFIGDFMMMNPGVRVYWDEKECHFFAEAPRGTKLRVGSSKLSFEVSFDEAYRAFYYVDDNNQRQYMLFLAVMD